MFAMYTWLLYLLFIYSMQSSHYVKRNKRIKHHLTWWRRGACNCHKHRNGLNVLVVVVGVMFVYTSLYFKFNSIDATVKRGVFEFEIYLKETTDDLRAEKGAMNLMAL